MKFILNMVYGCIIGVANIIPGVSGGTMAVILDIYDKLIDSITGIRKHFKKSMMFLIPIIIGGGAGIFGFAKLLEFLFKNYPTPTFFFFIGLILGSVPLVFRKATETKFKPVSIIPFIIFFGAMIALAFANTSGNNAASPEAAAAFQINVGSWLYLFFGSALAAMCMIIPGVSGSMILMIVGLYPTVLGSISHLTDSFMHSCMILLPVGLGVVVGFLGGAKLIDLCIKRFPQMTFFAIIGLMLGSIYQIYNNAVVAVDTQGYITVTALLVGLGIALLFSSDVLKNKFEKKPTETKTNTKTKSKAK